MGDKAKRRGGERRWAIGYGLWDMEYGMKSQKKTTFCDFSCVCAKFVLILRVKNIFIANEHKNYG